MRTYLDFEKPVADLQGKVQELRALGDEGDAVAINDEIARLEVARRPGARRHLRQADALAEDAGRPPSRPAAFRRLRQAPGRGFHAARRRPEIRRGRGDRRRRSAASAAGAIAVIGQEKGNDTESRIKHNFGMARPEGYRKAVRIMEMADRFGLPVLALVDTAGAYPGIGAEERGQAEAIARSTEACLRLGVPNVAVIIGEGGSGGAVAIATANKVLMLEHSIYTVASPEASASILWHDSSRAQDAATNMKITAQDLAPLRRHRPDHRGAGRRRPPRPRRRDRRDRRRDRRGALPRSTTCRRTRSAASAGKSTLPSADRFDNDRARCRLALAP